LHSYYYWDKEFKTKQNLTLKECLEKYGTTIAKTKNFYYKVIFLDENKSLGNSWMLWAKDYVKDENVAVTLYEKNPDNIIRGDI